MRLRTQQTVERMASLSVIGLVVGSLASIASIGFVNLVGLLNELLFIDPSSRAELGSFALSTITVLVLTLGGLIVGIILQSVDSGRNYGPSDVIEAVQLRQRLPTPLAGAASTVASIISLGCGASVGQYGPLVYLGALTGQLANRLKLSERDLRSISIACGVAAAISTVFSAPIAALIFTHEVILRHYSFRMFTAVSVASAAGYLIGNQFFASPLVFLVDIKIYFSAFEFLLFAIEGIACGIIAVIFLRLIDRCGRYANMLKIPFAYKPMLAGFAVALVAVQIPEVLGTGQGIFREAFFPGSYGSFELIVILIAKIVVTAICIGFGFAGGVIFPALLIGVLFGAIFAMTVPGVFLNEYSAISIYAICGMVAMMSPIIGAPMTALILVFEWTRNYEVTIVAMIAIVFANLIARHWYSRSYYDNQLMQRGLDLSQGRDKAYLSHHRVGDHLSQTLPKLEQTLSLAEADLRLNEAETGSAIVVDANNKFIGQIFQHQLQNTDSGERLADLEFVDGLRFNQNTSIWKAMESLRNYVGEAVPVVDSHNGKYLGSIPEATIIRVYLDASQELRREEHEV